VALAGLAWAKFSSKKATTPAVADASVTTTTTAPIASTVAPTEPPPTASPPSETAIGQAQALNALLVQSAAARSTISGAVTEISSCSNVVAGVQAFKAAGSARQRLLGELQRQSLTLLSNSEELRSTLNTAWQNSIQADASYAAWGTDLESGCNPSTSNQDANLAAAHATDPSSQAAKGRFANLWNQIATEFQLPLQNANSI
jgi:hypothetical protein